MDTNSAASNRMQDSRGIFPVGLVGDIAAFIYDSAPYPDEDVALLAALVFMAAICGRAYKVENLGLNLYAVLLALPGTGKDCAFSGITTLIEEVWIYLQANKEYHYQTIAHCGIPQSDVALRRRIAGDGQNAKFRSADTRDAKTKAKEPMYTANLSMIGLWDEATSFIQAILDYSNVTSPLVNMRTLLLGLFSESGKRKTLYGKSDYAEKERNIPDVAAPAFSFIAASQPPAFFKVVTTDNITDGLFPRLVMLEVANTRAVYNKDRIEKPSQALLAAIIELIKVCTRLEYQVDTWGRDYFQQVAFASDARREIDEYHANIDSRMRSLLKVKDGIGSALLSRTTELTKRISGLLAIGENMSAPMIEVRNIDKARTIVERSNSILNVKVKSGEMHSDDVDQRALATMKRVLRDFVKDKVDSLEWEDSYKDKYRVNDAVWGLPFPVASISYLRKECYKRAPFRDNRQTKHLFDRTINSLVEDGVIVANNDVIVASLKEKYPQAANAIDNSKVGNRLVLVRESQQLGDK